MHGNAAEWTRSVYRPYPFVTDDGRNDVKPGATGQRRVVRGGSYYDRPQNCRSAHRLAYPAWQGVHNVGFRIIVAQP
jgi:formylglycine-generating enzyme required for sulfatase activity